MRIIFLSNDRPGQKDQFEIWHHLISLLVMEICGVVKKSGNGDLRKNFTRPLRVNLTLKHWKNTIIIFSDPKTVEKAVSFMILAIFFIFYLRPINLNIGSIFWLLGTKFRKSFILDNIDFWTTEMLYYVILKWFFL